MDLTGSNKSFLELYHQKLGTADDAAQMLKDGSVCAADIALANSELFYRAVAKRMDAGELCDITQHSIIDICPAPFFLPEYADRYHGVTWFSGGYARKSVNAGLCDIYPAYYKDFPAFFENAVKPDVFIGVVSPMDKHGYFSTGASSSAAHGILANAAQVFLEVNENMPRSIYGPHIHISEVTALWENPSPLYELEPKEIDEASRRIGQIIAEEVPNGAALQLGIGAIPDAVGLALRDKCHMGIHTELLTDSMIDLISCGAVDNSRKEIYRGKTVASFAMGTRKMYDYIDDNPAVAMLPVDHVNDPAVISQLSNFVSVNSAVEVDFFGQVCAESFGTKHISGTGGQSDFVRGAVGSKGGKSFIAFASTAANGAQSKIVPTLRQGAQVSTSKNDVDMIVTEYGIAKLRGRTLSQRTKALISIAAPQFREELTYEARKVNILI